MKRGNLATGYSGSQPVTSPGSPITTAITGAANNGGGLIRLTVTSTALMVTGEPGLVSGVTGTTEANGDWTITVIDATHVDLQGSAFVHAYTGGGTLVVNPFATSPGTIQSLMAANFDAPDTYTLQFNVTTGSVLPIPTPSPIWPPPIGGEPPIPAIAQPVSSTQGVRCVATINWKVEGSQVQRIIDIGSGVSISGTCQGVDVSIQDLTYTVGGPAGVQYIVSAQVTRGVRPATSLPPILITTTNNGSESTTTVSPGPVVTLSPGDIADFTVPQNAGINSVEIVAFDETAPETDPIFLLVIQFNGSPLAGVSTKRYSAALQTGFVKIAPNATDVVIINRSTTDIAVISVAWGIDG